MVFNLYSKSVDGYYTGSCLDFTERFQRHLDKTYFDSYTRKASDWILYLAINGLGYKQARKIEKHIKSMKSRRYIENLKKYPEMVASLIEKYGAGSSR
ncbi:MAG TPA: endonuclease [Aequorivita sp.]|nr:endonuclease [Aequorivita sp.]HBL79172.1 endonuclease [Aequorivita sp.]|tara:strand:- start:46502 stop:46795 length:294 start_codon:yes stop_codon:yes gene_type:complete